MIEAALLAAIYAAPDDDDARLVYADWLQEQGNPRGELIALQIAGSRGVLTEEQHARERALLAEHAAQWIAPLPMRVPGVRFERGFVAKGEMTSGFIDEHPAWSTVRVVNSVPISDRCHTASLRVLSSIGYGGVMQLARLARPLDIETLVWNGPEYWDHHRWNTADDAIRAWSEIRVLPKLRALVLLGQDTWVDPAQAPEPRNLAWAWSSRYLPALAELTLPIAPSQVPRWVAALATTKLTRVELRTTSEDWRLDAWRLTFERDALGRLSRLTLRAPGRTPPSYQVARAADELVLGIRALPRALSEARVVVPGAMWERWNRQREDIVAALALHPNAKVTVDSAP